jgi:3-oxoadipate enol-lactonase
MRVFIQDGLSLYYRSHGNGEPVLLIHGLGGSGVDWGLQVLALERRFRVIVPDLPGCGSSSAPRGRHSIESFARALWSLLDRLEVPQINIVGFSMGGAVALEMALQRPSLVPRLALINSLATYRDQWRKWIFARCSGALIRLFGMRRAARMFAAGLFPDPWQSRFRDRAAAAVASVPASSYLSMSRALEQWEATDRLHRIKSRTLVIAAEHDHTPLAEKRALAAQLGASMVVVDGSRHGTPFDASEATNCSLLGLLTDQPLLPYERLACDPPTRAQVGFLGIRSRVQEMSDNGADTCGRQSGEVGYLGAAPVEAWELMPQPTAADIRRHL